MERLTLRSYILGGTLLLFGAALVAAPQANYPKKTESELEALAPTSVGKYNFYPVDATSGQSYKMSKMTYDTLMPFGIVARIFTSGNKSFDAVVIAGNDVNSFHDPRTCFTSQGYEILSETKIDIPTQSRGTVPATFAKLNGPRGKSMAIFLYRGPGGFVSKTRDLKIDMFKSRLTNGKEVDGVFYRFIPLSDQITDDEFKTFVADFLDTADKTSKGYF
ncbi:MAG: exosortase-associated EpsI family protein [Fimbriimonas sp.]